MNTAPKLSESVADAFGVLNRKIARQQKVLIAVKRCRGIDDTDQETGQTFRSLIDDVLKVQP